MILALKISLFRILNYQKEAKSERYANLIYKTIQTCSLKHYDNDYGYVPHFVYPLGPNPNFYLRSDLDIRVR